MDKFDKLVGQIYDCAANPELWTGTLSNIRDHLGAAYVLVSMAELTTQGPGSPPFTIFKYSPWDAEWFLKLGQLLPIIPSNDILIQSEIDDTVRYSAYVDQEVFRSSEFYKLWVEPQRLSDTLNVNYIKRQGINGVISATRSIDIGFFEDKQVKILDALSPHIRRAMLINDIVDKGKLALSLYQKVLDSLTVAVFVVGLGQRLAFTNSIGEELLSDGNFVFIDGGSFVAQRIGGAPLAFDDAIARALKGDVALGRAGIGVPLIGLNGERAAAYILPISGNDLRRDLGRGHAVVFVAGQGEQQPMAIEILRTVFDLTSAEARVTALIAKGEGPIAIAEAMNISTSTVRTHLSRSFQKTETHDQLALMAKVNALLPPIL